MPYNVKQYDAAEAFISTDENLSSSEWDQKRVAVYDLYEDIYRNAVSTLRIVLRGDDQSPILVPNGKKIIEATTRFLGKNVPRNRETATPGWLKIKPSGRFCG